MSKAKQKGTAAETAFVNYLKAQGYEAVERRVTNGARDRGDVAGLPGRVIEIKAGARLCIPEWLRELEVEVINAEAHTGYLVIKPKGKGDKSVDQWWVIQTVGQVFGNE